MKILLSSHRFSPDIGGIESCSAILATEFVRKGHELWLVTDSPGPDVRNWPFAIARKPAARELCGLVRWCDVFYQNNISLQALWPTFIYRKPWAVTHATWITKTDGRLGWRDHLKRFLLRGGTNISISRAMAASIGVESVLIGNPYDSETFRIVPGIARDRDLIFLGRLVSDKGVDLLLSALAHLRDQGRTPRLTIVGSGPEEPNLRELAAQLDGQVDFVGSRSGKALVELLHRHRIMVVPSRWAEPFGIVALEGIACGCVIVGSSDGGLPDAIGPCGLTFPNGDSLALANALSHLLDDDQEMGRLREAAPLHLQKFAAPAVADAYLKLFQRLI